MWDWRSLLLIADSIRQHTPRIKTDEDQARVRAAVSRAYYAAYHIAKPHIEGKYKVRLGRHTEFWRAVSGNATYTQDEQQAAREGDDLYTRRVHADYTNASIDPVWPNHRQNTIRQKQRARLESDMIAAILSASKILTLLGVALPPGLTPPTGSTSTPAVPPG